MKKASIKLKSVALVAFMSLALGGCSLKKDPSPSFEEFAWGGEETVSLSADQHEQAADGFLRRNKPEMAFVHFNKALKIDPENSAVRIKKGDLLVGKGLEEQALAEYLRVLEADPDHAQANEAAGAVFFRAGLFVEAETHLLMAVKANPMLWKAHNYLGNFYNRQERHDVAVEHFNEALEMHKGGGSHEIYNNLGVALIAMEEYDQAINSFRLALKNGGVSSRTYNNLGLALTRLGRLDEALEAFKYAGGEAKANNNLGYVLLTDGRPADAVPYFERAVETAPSYYVKAAENLKRARMAARFSSAPAAAENEIDGSTPNPLSGGAFPKAGQIPGGPAASPASAGPSTGDSIRKVAFVEANPGSEVLHTATPSNVETDASTWGVHVSSWRDHDWAFNHCEKLRKDGYDTWINQVDLGEKGIWYRVLVGRYASVDAARAVREEVKETFKLSYAPIYELKPPSPVGSQL